MQLDLFAPAVMPIKPPGSRCQCGGRIDWKSYTREPKTWKPNKWPPPEDHYECAKCGVGYAKDTDCSLEEAVRRVLG
jgi:DNA-directed RNA polymerase subunit RPC12/RpoP